MEGLIDFVVEEWTDGRATPELYDGSWNKNYPGYDIAQSRGRKSV